MKRIFIFILCLCFVFTSLLTAASAASSDGIGKQNNLLDNYAEFNIYSDVHDYISPYPYAAFDFGDDVVSREGSIFFGLESVSFYFEELFLYFTSDRLIRDVSLRAYVDDQFSFSYGEVELISSDNNYLYCASFYESGTFLDSFAFTFYLESPSTEFSIGLIDFSTSNSYSTIFAIDSIGFRVDAFRYNAGDYSYYRDSIYDNDVSVPFAYNYGDEPGGDDIADDLLNVFMQFDFGSHSYIDKLQFTFISTGIYHNYYNPEELSSGGLYLETYDGTFNIPYFVDSSIMESSWYGLPVYRYTITADLSSFDLASGQLVFSTGVYGRYPYGGNNRYCDWYFRIENGYSFIYTPLDLPWYKAFFNWLDHSLTDFFNNLGNRFITGTDSIVQKLQDIFQSEDSAQQEAVNDAVNNMNAAADQFGQANEDMDEIMPGLPSYDDIGLNELSQDAVISVEQTGSAFSAIWDSDIIVSLLTYTALLSLGGFLLFGER